MSKFPEALPLDRKIKRSRLSRRKELLLTARRGVLLRAVIIVAELLGFVFWKSSALMLDALSCSIDVTASLILMWCIRLADKPPDADHPMGHGRFEPIAGLLVGFSLVILGTIAAIEQIKAISQGHVAEGIEPMAWMIPLLALVLLEICYQFLKKTAKRKNSPALMADAVHYRIDAITCLFALIALGLAAGFPQHAHLFDHFGAGFIALFMIVVGLLSARRNIDQLIDRSPPDATINQVRAAAVSVEGVLATEKCRMQVYGPDAHVAIDIEVDPTLSVLDSHRLTQQVRRAIQRSLPTVRDVMVHVEPYYPGDHDET